MLAEMKRASMLLDEQKRAARKAQGRSSRRAGIQRRRTASVEKAINLPQARSSASPNTTKLKRVNVRPKRPPAAPKRSKVSKNYCRPAISRAERLGRWFEQRRIAAQNGLKWRKLTSWERRKRVRFGTNAWCHTAKDARDLTRITGNIAHDRERAAVKRWTMDAAQKAMFEAVCGFKRPPRLIASNKLIRRDATYTLAKTMLQSFKDRRKLNFYFITLINDSWHTRHDQTNVNLDEVQRDIDTLLRPTGLSWLGMIEIDIFNNYPGRQQGCWTTPHGHAFIWSRKPLKPRKYAEQLAQTSGFTSALTSKPVTIQRIASAKDIAHLCFYINKPNYQCKAVGQEDVKTGKRGVYTSEKSVRPAYTLRIAEILSYCTLPNLILAGGNGVNLKRKWLKSLRRRQERPGDELVPFMPTAAFFWDDIKPGRSKAMPIQVIKNSGRARKPRAARPD